MNGVLAAADGLERINDGLLLVCRHLVILIVASLAILLSAAVFWRYALNDAISWSEEAAKYLMVWLTFLGAPIALRHGGHINIDVLLKMVPRRIEQLLELVIHAIIVLTMAILVWKGYSLAEMGARQVASSFRMSMVWMTAAVPIGSAVILLVALERALRALVGIARPEAGLVNTHASWAEEIRE